VLGVALAVRLAWVLLVPNEQYSDSVWYAAAAWNLAAHGVYGPDAPSAWFPPGYPFFLSAIYAVAGHSELAGKLGNVALGVAMTGFTYLLARLFVTQAAALVAGVIVALWPNLVFSTGILSSDVLAACGFVAALWLGMRRGAAWPTSIALGVLIGWMILVRPISGILIIALALWWVLDKRSLRPLSAVVVIAALVVAGWTMRNYVQFGQPILIATNGGYNFWQTNHRFADGNDTFWSVVPMDDPEYQTMRNGDEFTKNSAGYRYAIAYLEAHPLHLVTMLPTKLFWLWHTDTSGFYEGVFDAPMAGPSAVADWIRAHAERVESLTFRYYEALMVLAVLGVGITLLRRQARWVWPLVSMPLMLCLFHMFFHAKDRFHIPVDGVIALFAAIALVEAASLVRAAARGELPFSTARARLRRAA
jgi:4-amino-4-deoxy-L-arabinose transferase-like glycosyltransferase